MRKDDLSTFEDRLKSANIVYTVNEAENGYLDLIYLSALGEEIIIEFRPDGSLI
ncbi:hypothetical protein [Zooshikella sp. RANM57]|uniref:hypothetical protein n=1 Tax=Zooshikella sp. RANM57 TaxID=3425863 RepID=UPI003D6E768D